MTAVAQNFSKVVFGNPIGCDHKDANWGEIGGRWYKISSHLSKVDANFPIKPSMIISDFCGTFGRLECEGFAEKLVRFAQKRGGWHHVSVEALAEAGEDSGYNTENLSFFAECGWLVQDEDDTYAFTLGFVTEVYERTNQYW